MRGIHRHKIGIIVFLLFAVAAGMIALLSHQIRHQFYNSLTDGIETKTGIVLPKGSEAETYRTDSDFFFSKGMTYAVFFIPEDEQNGFAGMLAQQGWNEYTVSDYAALFATENGQLAAEYLPTEDLSGGWVYYAEESGSSFVLCCYEADSGKLYCCLYGE